MLSVNLIMPGAAGQPLPAAAAAVASEPRQLPQFCSRLRHRPVTSFNSAGGRRATTALSLFVNAMMAGYAFAKLRFPAATRSSGYRWSALVVPAQMAMLPLFLLMKAWNCTWSTAMPGVVPRWLSIFSIFMVRQYASFDPER